MARRGRKPKFKMNLEHQKETALSAVSLFAILGGGVCFLAVVAGMFSSGTGVNSYLAKIVTNNFGLASIFLAILLIYSGLLFIGSLKWSFLNYRVLSGIGMVFVGVLGLLGTGKVGLLLQNGSSKFMSFPGALFFYLCLFIIGIFTILNKGHEHFFNSVSNFFSIFTGRFLKINLPEEGTENADALMLEPGTEEAQYNVKKYAEAEVEDPEEVEEGKSYDFTVNHKMAPALELENLPQVHHKYSEIEMVRVPSAPVGEDDENAGLEEAPVKKKVPIVEEVPVGGTPKLPFSNKVWEYPSIELLSDDPGRGPDAGNVQERAKSIEDTLTAFGVKANVVDIKMGPAVTQYALNPAIGTKASKISNLATDLALRIKSPSGSVRVVAPIPGTNLVGVEVPNFSPSSVNLRSVLSSQEMKKAKSKLTVAIGVDVQGNPVVQNLGAWPHALIAGATGSGKSVMLNALIASLLFRCSPAECRFIMIDPKMVELTQYNGIPHLLTPVVTDIEQKAVSVFAWAVSEMERRYKIFAAASARNIEAYNAQSGFQAEPYIVIIVDELADMMMVASNDIERYIARLAQKSRATGIHLILATQRPSVNVLTGIIKANIPTRFAFKVTSNVDSRVVIDQSGAETLIGKGDMLFVPPTDSKAMRIQGVWVSDPEINALVDKLKQSGIEPDYREEIVQQKVLSNNSSSGKGGGGNIEEVDEKMMEALEIVIGDGKASASYLQRRLGLGYSRAARIIDELESAGIIGRANGSKPRDILVDNVEEAVAKMGGSEKED